MHKFNPDIHHRRSIRLKEYDYSQAGLYFITICTHNRKCLFGEIANGVMLLNDAGKIVNETWLKTPDIRPNVELNKFVVMPNHFHAIFTIVQSALHKFPNDHNRRGELNSPLNENTPENNIDNPIKGEFNSPLRSPSQTVGAIVRGFKSSVSKQIGFPVWQRNYHEHIIRDFQSYQKISDYIMNNPAKWGNDKFYK